MLRYRIAKSCQIRLYEDGSFRRVSDLVRQEKALCGINAGFYSGRWSTHPKGSVPCGQLVINDVNVRFPADQTPEGTRDAHYHALYKKGGRLVIDRWIPYPESGKPVEWGIKMGPRLLQAGEVCLESINDPRWDINRKACPRVAVGVLEDGRATFVYDTSTTPEKLAEAMKELGCLEAIGCDGDSSASYVDVETGDSYGYKQVPNALLVMPEPVTESESGKAPGQKPLRVYISPSQQPGNVGVGDYGDEQTRMHQLAWFVYAYLNRAGCRLRMAPFNSDIGPVISDSNRFGADLHLCLHSNANGKGVDVFWCPGSRRGEPIARAMYAALVPMNPHGDHRCEPARFMELTDTEAPAVYVEVGFHSDPEEAAWIVRDMDRIAKTLAEVVVSRL